MELRVAFDLVEDIDVLGAAHEAHENHQTEQDIDVLAEKSRCVKHKECE